MLKKLFIYICLTAAALAATVTTAFAAPGVMGFFGGIGEGTRVAEEAGFRSVTMYQNREPILVAIKHQNGL